MKKNQRYTFGNRETEIIFSEDFLFPKERGVAIVDSKVFSLYQGKLNELLNGLPVFIFKATEQNKSLKTVSEIYKFFQENNVNRSHVIYGVGGGITTDIAGFSASTYMRGCRLHLLPTTFLGMIDAAIGGKTAVNFQQTKNNIGSFYPAEKVYIFPEFLRAD
jgi:3-dehydroquinate synthase